MQNIIKIYTVAVETNVKLLRLPKHIILPPVFSGFVMLCIICCISLLLSVFFYLSVLRRCMASHYPFGININCYKIQNIIIIHIQFLFHYVWSWEEEYFSMVVVTILNVWSTQEKDENVISEIAFISYAESQKIEKPNHWKSVRARKSKMLNNYLR